MFQAFCCSDFRFCVFVCHYYYFFNYFLIIAVTCPFLSNIQPVGVSGYLTHHLSPFRIYWWSSCCTMILLLIRTVLLYLVYRSATMMTMIYLFVCFAHHLLSYLFCDDYDDEIDVDEIHYCYLCHPTMCCVYAYVRSIMMSFNIHHS